MTKDIVKQVEAAVAQGLTTGSAAETARAIFKSVAGVDAAAAPEKPADDATGSS